MIVFLSILSTILFCSTCFLGFLAYRAGEMLMQIEENAENLLEIMDTQLDNAYSAISEVYLEHDVAFVRFMSSLRDVRLVLEKSLNSLVSPSEEFQLEIGEEIIALAQNDEKDDDTPMNSDTTKSQEKSN